MMNLEEIKRILPHRYPMLLIDRVLELDPGSSCKAIKNVTANEQVFQGHFPQMAVMPGVMIVEAMAQVGGIVIHSVTPEDIAKQSLVFFCRDRKISISLSSSTWRSSNFDYNSKSKSSKSLGIGGQSPC